jgi:hypothetical protein
VLFIMIRRSVFIASDWREQWVFCFLCREDSEAMETEMDEFLASLGEISVILIPCF